jgi:hypothetical protein
MKFPVIKNGYFWRPKVLNGKCSLCGVKSVGSNKFYYIMGGALYGKNKDNCAMSNKTFGYLTMGIHNHDSCNYKHLDLIESSCNGQFDLYFCSKKCLKRFFNEILKRL